MTFYGGVRTETIFRRRLASTSTQARTVSQFQANKQRNCHHSAISDVLSEIELLPSGAITPEELKKVHAQLRPSFVYDGYRDTDIAHKNGY